MRSLFASLFLVLILSGHAFADVSGSFSGVYTCDRRQAPVVVEFSPKDLSPGMGRFVFGDGEGSSSGAYVFEVVPGELNKIELRPVRWERRPGNQEMIGAEVRIFGQELMGRMLHPNCGIIQAKASAAPVAPPAASPAKSTNVVTSARAESAINALLNELVSIDSRRWMLNRYDRGSMKNGRVVSNQDGVTVIQGDYTYNGGASGWARARFRGQTFECIEFWDFAGTCRPIGAAPSQALVGAFFGVAP